MLRRLVPFVTVFALVALAAVGACAFSGGSQVPVAQAQQTTVASPAVRHITVVGRGKVTVEPDIAMLNLGVQTKAEKVDEAVSENQEIMEAILEALDEAGVAEEDIRTAYYNIYLDEGYYGPEVAREPVYRVYNMVIVKVRDLDSIGAILDAVIKAGANQIQGVNFTLEDWTQAEVEAREKAMENARERAEHLAQLADAQLGQVISVSEVIGGGMLQPPVEMAAGLGGGAGPISPGQLDYSTSIQVTYAIEQP